MFLHELSRTASRHWAMKVESEAYAENVRLTFENRCPYCNTDLLNNAAVVEHLDGMNRSRVGLHVPGNVLVACRRCNNEKRRDDSIKELTLAPSGWESFLSHDGRCGLNCRTCAYWVSIWPIDAYRRANLEENAKKIKLFRSQFMEFECLRMTISEALPELVGKLYFDCQNFAENEIKVLLQVFMDKIST